MLISRITPPHCRNWLIWSTSPVTRETSEPRRSDCWCSIDRSWMWRKVRGRRPARAVSLTVKRRTFIRYAQIIVPPRIATVTATIQLIRPMSGPPGARSPLSMPCWMATGMATRPSGDIASPRLRVCHADSATTSLTPHLPGVDCGARKLAPRSCRRLVVGALAFPLRLGLLVRGDEGGVPLDGLQQMRVGTAGDYPAVFEVDHLIGEGDRGAAVRHDQD